MLFPTLGQSRHALWWSSLTQDMQTEQLLCWSGMADTEHSKTSGSNEVVVEELVLLRLVRCELSRLRCHGHSLLLSSYLCRIKRRNSSYSACRHHLQNLTHLLLDCPHLSLSGVPSLALLLPFFTSGPDLGAWPDCWVS